jgi:hypothetical protein
VATRVDASFDNPGDNPDQGLIQGSIQQELDFLGITGDVRMGQISMRSSGVVGGAAQVIIRAEYIPRNINQFQFTVASTEAFTVSKVAVADGGLVEDWTLTSLGGGTYSLTAPTPEDVLLYGSFGDLLALDFPAVAATPFTVALVVNNALYAGDKYFVYPDTLSVDTGGSFAPAFPTPVVQPLVVDFGTAATTELLTIQNIGGSYPYPPGLPQVQLEWEITEKPSYITAVPDEGSRNTTVGVDTVTLTLNRTISPGDYAEIMLLKWDGGTLNVGDTIPITITATILPPVLAVNPLLVDLGAVDTEATFEITYTGQSVLSWSMDTTAFPDWLSVAPSFGDTRAETDTITVGVDRTGLVSGFYTHLVTVTSDGGTAVVTVHMIVP